MGDCLSPVAQCFPLHLDQESASLGLPSSSGSVGVDALLARRVAWTITTTIPATPTTPKAAAVALTTGSLAHAQQVDPSRQGDFLLRSPVQPRPQVGESA